MAIIRIQTHHMLVWMMADEVYPGQDAILVIADRQVAERYQQLMASVDVLISKVDIEFGIC